MLSLSLLAISPALSAAPKAAKAPSACPEGLEQAGDRPPKGFAVACVNDKGENHGPFTIWHGNGKKKSEGSYERGQVHGPFTEWHDNGIRKAAGRFDNGRMTGHWVRWHPNGAKKDEGEWNGSEPVGDWKFWRADGSLAAEGRYRDGKKDCGWAEYSAKGKKSVIAPDGIKCGAAHGHSFAFGSLFLMPSERRNQITLEFSFHPRISLSRRFKLEGDLSAAPIPQEADTGKLRALARYGLLLAVHPKIEKTVTFAVGGGGISWIGRGTRPQATLRTVWGSRYVVGYSAWFFPGDLTHVLNLGIDLPL